MDYFENAPLWEINACRILDFGLFVERAADDMADGRPMRVTWLVISHCGASVKCGVPRD